MGSGPVTILSPNGGSRVKRAALIAIAGAIFALAFSALRLITYRQNVADVRSLPEAPSYAAQLRFSDLHLSAEENFLGQQVVYLDGQLANQGPKIVRRLGVRLFFRNILNQIVLREEHEVIGGAQSLGPGQARAFQIRFDEVPDSWNRQVPELQIISLRVQQP